MNCTGASERFFAKRFNIVIIAFLALVLFASGVIGFVSTIKTVTLVDGDQTITVKSRRKTVQAFLEQRNVSLGTGDQTVPGLGEKLKNGSQINVYRSINMVIFDGDEKIYARSNKETIFEALNSVNLHVTEYDNIQPEKEMRPYDGIEINIQRATPCILVADGQTMNLFSCEKTVGGLLTSQNILLNGEDRASKPLDASIEPNETIEIIRVSRGQAIEEEVVEFETITRESTKLEKGQTREIQNGVDGLREVTYETQIENGIVVAKNEISSVMKTEPVKRIVEYGTISVATTSRGDSFRYKRVINAVATAYDLSYESCGKNPGDPGYGITSSGRAAAHGVIAVDPSVIPLGTRLYVEAANGKSWTYGYAVAGDTGSSIKGNRVDLFFNSTAEAKRFGRRNAKVYVLE